MKKRVAYLIVDGKQFGDENHSLEIQFNITYSGNALIPLDAVFVVDNLKKDDVYYITDNASLFASRNKDIQFWAGYKGQVRKLYDGKIRVATPSGQPDTSLTITAMQSYSYIPESISVEYYNISFLDLLRDWERVSLMPVLIPENIKTSPTLLQKVDFFYTGSVSGYLNEIINWITGFNTVKEQIIFSQDVSGIIVSNQDNVNLIAPIIPINSATGMVGIPKPNAAGIDITVLMDTALRAGMTIELTSTMLPKYNGLYNIQSVTYHGSVRGNDFYTDLHCTQVYKGTNNGTTNL